MALSKRVTDRISSELKKYITILQEAQNRDISESDTVVIINDMLSDVLGYKKYTEVTTEFAIRGTYVDLAVKVNDEVRFLVEGKAIGLILKDNHVKQAMEYGAHHGIEWVVLTNGVIWRVYKVHFRQPIDQTLIFEINLLELGAKPISFVEQFGLLAREGFTQSSMNSYYQHQQITGKYTIAAILQTPAVVAAIRKEIKKLAPTIKPDDACLLTCITDEVIKRELLESEEAKEATAFIKKVARANERKVAKAAVDKTSE
ncbi:type I restriction enzyme HsdR N-terminal domain-containing protein [Methylobacillus gramineus]|uniref:type I restriction enzyme HsdR N-terminal domain-containing protein n=1 Tax=Methylobacillus gramineus TaxID=755169 RepID=UPI001CFFAB69|nr:type I restriction enzyme HsdR N-terminal domain-containing protein [Methylobacillus gramineus]MCB5185023.1 type I restriction enzyme HsdR N-terminal domain-containing protein [Methylobacillus gramineus]